MSEFAIPRYIMVNCGNQRKEENLRKSQKEKLSSYKNKDKELHTPENYIRTQ